MSLEALRILHSSAHVQGGTQRAPELSLGGVRAGSPMRRMSAIFTASPIPNIEIVDIAGANGEGTGYIMAPTADTLTWTAPGGTEGTAVAVADGATVMLQSGSDIDAAILVKRLSDDDMNVSSDAMELELVIPYDSLLGMGDVASADVAAGDVNCYRGPFLYNAGSGSITDLEVSTPAIDAGPYTTDTAHLPASGTGTIETTGTIAAAVPYTGLAIILTAASAFREAVYYQDRTDHILYVTATGRGVAGTEEAGAVDDVVIFYTGPFVGTEAPDGNGNIQIIADVNTAPAAITFGLSEDSLTIAAGACLGLWLWRPVPEASVATPDALHALSLAYTYDGESYAETIYAKYRVANAALERYELYGGVEGAEPDFTAAPDVTGAALPLAFEVTPPGSGTREYKVAILKRNAYNLASYNTYTRSITIDAAGDEVVADPSAPVNVTLTDAGGGYLQLVAEYDPDNDTSPADAWRATVTDTDADSAPVVSVVSEAMVAGHFSTAAYVLRETIGPFAKGTPVQASVTTYRTSDTTASAATTASATVTSTPAQAPQIARVFVGETSGEERWLPELVDRTVTISASPPVTFTIDNGVTEFLSDTTVIWRALMDGADASNNGFWTTLSFDETAVSGAGTGPVEVVDANTIYLTVNGVRRVKVDLTAGTIQAGGIMQGDAYARPFRTTDAAKELELNTVFQVYDRETESYHTYLTIDDDGTMRLALPWRQYT